MPDYPGLPIGQIALDAQFRVVSVDPQFRWLFGGGADLVGTTLDDLISERDRRGAVALSSRLMQHRGELIDLPLVISVGGDDRYVRLRLVMHDGGGSYTAYFEPGDAEGSLTYELALARERWSALLRRTDEGIALLSPTGTIVQHNQRFFDLMRFRNAHGISLTESALEGRRLVSLLSRSFEPLTQCLLGDDDEFSVRIKVDGRTLEAEGRTLRLPLRGRLETLLLLRDLSEQQQIADRDAVIQADLEQAARFQSALLAQKFTLPGLAVDVAYRPLHRVGGDLFDIVVLDDQTVRLFIADATGHGVTAALSTMLIKSEYDAIKRDSSSPSEILSTLNERITRTYDKLAIMFTAAIVDIAPDRTNIRHSCGAHPAPVLWRDDKPVELAEGGPFLGAMPSQSYPEWSSSGPWSSLVMLTDGLTDARDASGRHFGEHRLYDSVGDALLRGRKVTANVLSHLDAFIDSQRLTDDITLLVIQPQP
jgi:serine phosphatase RsbU (regulator of sigma subunit)